METGSVLFTFSIFLLGATCGGLFVTLHRQARMEQIKAKFQHDLAQECELSAPVWMDQPVPVENNFCAPEPEVSAVEPDFLDELDNPEWEEWSFPPGVNGPQARPHV